MPIDPKQIDTYVRLAILLGKTFKFIFQVAAIIFIASTLIELIKYFNG